jgi:hypothetical protein
LKGRKTALGVPPPAGGSTRLLDLALLPGVCGMAPRCAPGGA